MLSSLFPWPCRRTQELRRKKNKSERDAVAKGEKKAFYEKKSEKRKVMASGTLCTLLVDGSGREFDLGRRLGVRRVCDGKSDFLLGSSLPFHPILLRPRNCFLITQHARAETQLELRSRFEELYANKTIGALTCTLRVGARSPCSFSFIGPSSPLLSADFFACLCLYRRAPCAVRQIPSFKRSARRMRPETAASFQGDETTTCT